MPTHKHDEALLRQIGLRLREARDRVGLTQSQLAERIGIEPVTLSRYETGARGPSVTTLSLAAGAVGVSLAELVGEADLPAPSKEPLVEQGLALLRRLDEQHLVIAVEVLASIARTARKSKP